MKLQVQKLDCFVKYVQLSINEKAILKYFYIIFWFDKIIFVRAAFWFLSPKGRRIQAQKAQHDEFVESGLKN